MFRLALVALSSIFFSTSCSKAGEAPRFFVEEFDSQTYQPGWQMSGASVDREDGGRALLYPKSGGAFTFIAFPLSSTDLKGKMLTLQGKICCDIPDTRANVWITFFNGSTSMYTFHGLHRGSDDSGAEFSITVPWPPDATSARIGAFNEGDDQVSVENISLSLSEVPDFTSADSERAKSTDEFLTTFLSRSVYLQSFPSSSSKSLRDYAELLDRSPDFEDALPQFRRALILRTGDAHSLFFDHRSTASLASSNTQPPFHYLVDESAGYGYIYAVGTFDQTIPASRTYAKSARDALEQMVSAGTKRFVIDLRDNHGGNMWPLICALAPLLPGEYGAFTYPDGEVKQWSDMAENWANHASFEQGTCLTDWQQIAPSEVIVLVSEQTASSGEAVAIALKSSPNSVIVGRPTYGLTSANEGVLLKDGSQLFVAASWMTGSDGAIYRKGILVDSPWEASKRGPLSSEDIEELIQLDLRRSP